MCDVPWRLEHFGSQIQEVLGKTLKDPYQLILLVNGSVIL